VHAEQDTRQYLTGVKVSDKDMKKINLKKHNFHGALESKVFKTSVL